MTIARYGERWIAESMTGVAYRSLNDHPDNVLGDVASSNMEKYEIIRIRIMSTKICALLRLTVEILAM